MALNDGSVNSQNKHGEWRGRHQRTIFSMNGSFEVYASNQALHKMHTKRILHKDFNDDLNDFSPKTEGNDLIRLRNTLPVLAAQWQDCWQFQMMQKTIFFSGDQQHPNISKLGVTEETKYRTCK